MSSTRKRSVAEFAASAGEAATAAQQQRELRKRDARIAELAAANKELHAQLDEAARQVDAAAALQGKPAKARKIRRAKKTGREVTAFAFASDWHVGEVVDPETVNGRNKYTPEIAEARARVFFQRVLRLVEMSRAGWDVSTLVLVLGGDMMTGYIHEELMEGNALSPNEEVLFCMRLVRDGLSFLLEHGQFERIVVPCVYGNHGRTTQKRRIATGAKNSWEWLMYQQLAMQHDADDRVEFVVANGAHLYLDVYDATIRIHHGDDVRYYGGVGGLSIPLRKATDAWNDFRHADLTLVGHWHQLVDYGYAVVNGSLIGYSPYALSIKARYERPQQAFFLWHPTRGKCLFAPVWVDDGGKVA